MKPPTIRQARELSKSLDARGVIVLAFSEDSLSGASYGKTKRECAYTGYTMDRIIEALESGEIPVWATQQSEAERNARIVREAVAEGTYCPVCEVPWSECDCEDSDRHPTPEDE